MNSAVDGMRKEYRIIDADTHLTEPHDLWISRAPQKYRHRMPRVEEHDGIRSWIIDDGKILAKGAAPACAVLRDGGKVRNFEKFRQVRYEDTHPGAHQLQDRLAYMDENGVWAQIVYPNLLGFGGQNSVMVDPELRLVSIQVYNDAMAEWQESSGGRFCPMALLPWWDISEAVRETRRIAELGLKGININPTPYLHKDDRGKTLPDLSNPHWDPLWEICEALRLPINFHIGSSEQTINWLGSQGWPGLGTNGKWAIGGAMLFFENAQTMSNIIISGLLDRFQKLQFVSVESGIGWIPYLLEALDYQFNETAEGQGLEKKPSEYFSSNFYGCFWFEQREICSSIRTLGVENCLFESDFPHPTCLYPVDDINARLSAFSAEERFNVMMGNSARLYNIELPV